MMWQLAPGSGGGTPPGYDDLVAEIEAARGDRSQLGLRIDTISNFASPASGGIVPGKYYDNSFHGATPTVLIGAANRVDMAPYFSSQSLSIDQLGIGVSTGVGGALVRCFIYSAGSNGWPDTLLHETPDLSAASAVYTFETLSFDFDAGRQYWLGVRHSSTATVRTIPLTSAVNLGLSNNSNATYLTVIRRTLAFATPLPSTWGFTDSELVSNVTPPSIRMRAA